MAFPQLLTFPTPLRRSPSFKRKLQDATKRTRRIVLNRTRLFKRYVNQTAKKHYFLSTAFRDLRGAAKQNEDVVIAAASLTMLLTYGCTVLAANFILELSKTTYALSDASGFNMGLLIILAMVIVGVFVALIAATATNFMSIAIMDGANRKIYRSIRSTLVRSLSAASRITCAWFLLGIVYLARLLAILIPLIVYLKFLTGIMVFSNEVVIAAAAIISLLWLATGVLRFSLVPYVALFEPQYLLNESFSRSRQLVNKQAALFMVTGFGLLIAYTIGLFRLCVYLKQWLGIGTNLLFAIGLLAALMLANGAMVMLYRKRKMARR